MSHIQWFSLVLLSAFCSWTAGASELWDSSYSLGNSGEILEEQSLTGSDAGDGLTVYHLAQFDADDSFDPFADYSEFEAAEDEEADINFFRNGRFVTMGFIGGTRQWTQGLGKLLSSSSPHFGVFLSYFFDLRFALQFSFITGDHKFSVKSGSGATATGTVGIQNFGIDLKFYMNTQNVTRGLAAFNPYLIAGMSQMFRTTKIDQVTGFGKEVATAFDMGAGIELPMMRNKMFFGGQAMYQLVSFKNENSQVVFSNGDQTGIYPTGDTLTLLGILGVNF